MTATPFRDFDAEELEPLPPAAEFRLGGRTWHVRNPDDVEVGKLTAVASTVGGELSFQPGEFFAHTLVPDEVDAFIEMLNTPPESVTRRKVRTAMTHVFEIISDFPTTPDSGSSTVSPPVVRKPRSSKGRSSSPATRRAASGE